LPLQDLAATGEGLALEATEEFTLTVGPHPFSPPRASVTHTRFAGHPHVLQGTRICLYLDPSREWRPELGMEGLLDRLWNWLDDAAAGRFDAATALYHPVGGVLHAHEGTPTIVVRDLPQRGGLIERCWFHARTPDRLDTAATHAGSSAAGLLIHAPRPMPYSAGTTLKDVADRLQEAGGANAGNALVAALLAATRRNPDGTPTYFVVAVPHPAVATPHLIAGRVSMDPSTAPTSTLSATTRIEWCPVSDERTEVTTRRDAARPTSSFIGTTVHVWGCGGLGSWIAEFIARAGAATIHLCDHGTVTGGLLVRQNYRELDVGASKANRLADHLRAIRDDITVITHPTAWPEGTDWLEPGATDVIIDATISLAIGTYLDAAARSPGRTATLAQVAVDLRTGSLGLLSVSPPGTPHGPRAIDLAAGPAVLASSALEPYHALWLDADPADEVIPTRGCSSPTFNGSAADLASSAATAVSLIGNQLVGPRAGTYLFSSAHSGTSPSLHFIAAADSQPS
jgi:hypothetical protein